MTPVEIRDYISKYKITSRRDQVKHRAIEWFCGNDNQLVELLRGRIQGAVRNDPALAAAIDVLLEGAAVDKEHQVGLRGEIIHKFMERLREHFTDGKAGAEKRNVLEKQLNMLLQDAAMRTILSDK
jgi:hypothetical protein